MEIRIPTTFTDDIPAAEWLREINFEDYIETFVTNCPSSEGTGLLSRKRLTQLRLQDFPKMNVKNYEHAKILLEHIRTSLRFEYSSPIRKKEVTKRNKERGILVTWGDEEPEKAVEKLPKLKGIVIEEKAIVNSKKVEKRRRRSFDNQVWQSISNLRTAGTSNAAAAVHLREGFFPAIEKDKESEKDKSLRTRRWTLTPEEQNLTDMQKGLRYGNIALELDMIHKEMIILQKEVLNKYRDSVGCQIASIRFLNERNGELVFMHDHKTYRHSITSGFAGHCAQTGEVVLVADAKSDFRHNRYS
jgi:hypothetical protein